MGLKRQNASVDGRLGWWCVLLHCIEHNVVAALIGEGFPFVTTFWVEGFYGSLLFDDSLPGTVGECLLCSTVHIMHT